MESGMVHIYCGDGKGKTSAAVGLAARAAGAGLSVLFAQFLKTGDSAELAALAEDVTKEDVQAIAKSIECDLIYFLKGSGEEDGSDDETA